MARKVKVRETVTFLPTEDGRGMFVLEVYSRHGKYLAVTRVQTQETSGNFQITHMPSGHCCGDFALLKDARYVAEKLKDAPGWEKDLLDQSRARETIKELGVLYNTALRWLDESRRKS